MSRSAKSFGTYTPTKRKQCIHRDWTLENSENIHTQYVGNHTYQFVEILTLRCGHCGDIKVVTR